MTRWVPSKLPFRLDKSMPRESQLLNECLVRKRDRRRLSQQIWCVCTTAFLILYRKNIFPTWWLFWYFSSCKRSGFCLSWAACSNFEPLKSEKRQVLPFNYWGWQIGSLQGKRQQFGEMAHFPAKWNDVPFKKSSPKSTCLLAGIIRSHTSV